MKDKLFELYYKFDDLLRDIDVVTEEIHTYADENTAKLFWHDYLNQKEDDGIQTFKEYIKSLTP